MFRSDNDGCCFNNSFVECPTHVAILYVLFFEISASDIATMTEHVGHY